MISMPQTLQKEILDLIDLIEGLRNLRQSVHKHDIHSHRCAKQGDEYNDLDIYIQYSRIIKVQSNMNIVSLILLGLVHLARDSEEVQIKPMETIPGLLSDPFKKIYLIREEWQIVTSINIEKLINLYPYANQSIWEAFGICATKFKPSICSSYTRINSHQEIEAEIEQAKHRLRQHLEDPQLEKLDKTTRNRRAPWFGSIGTIARKLFGTMDYKRIRDLVRTSAYLQQSVSKQLSDLERAQLFSMAEDEHIYLMTNYLRTLNNAEEAIEDAK
ncbi:Protein of unknown function [Cotesia congregata]|uniref:Uncharacterized protein n=1 Tax=Cotesia congregata TaxID=51543 RepID=A0A8J2HCW8_COTCN|nr:Protein of unknown function [Cotesia congregata]